MTACTATRAAVLGMRITCKTAGGCCRLRSVPYIRGTKSEWTQSYALTSVSATYIARFWMFLTRWERSSRAEMRTFWCRRTGSVTTRRTSRERSHSCSLVDCILLIFRSSVRDKGPWWLRFKSRLHKNQKQGLLFSRYLNTTEDIRERDDPRKLEKKVFGKVKKKKKNQHHLEIGGDFL